MKINLISLMPQMLEEALAYGLVGQAFQAEKAKLEIVNPRDYATDNHKSVDDRPFGGGDGMLMMGEPLKASLQAIETPGHVVYLSPQGKKWRQDLAVDWSQKHKAITLICGRYGGVDQRFLSQYVDEEISVGDYVLTGGEPAAISVVDSLVRLLPGVLGNRVSAECDSFSDGLLEGPYFTRPRELFGVEVPSTMTSGNHAEIFEKRRYLSLLYTQKRRPDLLNETHKKELLKAQNWWQSLPTNEQEAYDV